MTAERSGLIVLSLAILAFLPSAAGANNEPSTSKAEKRTAKKVLQISKTSNRKLAKLRFSSSSVDRRRQQALCLERVIEPVEANIFNRRQRLTVGKIIITAAQQQDVYDLVSDHPQAMAREQRWLNTRRRTLLSRPGGARRPALLSALVAQSNEIAILRLSASWMEIDFCHFDQLLSSNNGYASASKYMLVIKGWRRSWGENLPPTLAQRLTYLSAKHRQRFRRGQRAINRALAKDRRLVPVSEILALAALRDNFGSGSPEP
jgi:hypothetical protein